MSRLRSRGWTEAHILQRLARQWSMAEKARQADVVLLNDGGLSHLEAQLQRLMRDLGLRLPML